MKALWWRWLLPLILGLLVGTVLAGPTPPLVFGFGWLLCAVGVAIAVVGGWIGASRYRATVEGSDDEDDGPAGDPPGHVGLDLGSAALGAHEGESKAERDSLSKV